MKKKFAKTKIIGLTLLAALTLAPAPTVLADDAQTLPAAAPKGELTAPAPLLAPYYLEFSGKVTEINPWYNLDGSESGKLFVMTEGSDGMVMNFVVDEKTVMLTENELKTGANITGFYLGNAPAIMIYPPQMHAEVLAVDLPPQQNVKAALFDENLLSDDGELKLNIGADTKFEMPDGTPSIYSDPFFKPWVVFYSVTTRSLPPQTTPTRIVVLPAEERQPAPADDYDHPDITAMQLVVENIVIEAPAAYYGADGYTAMVPLRAIAEALGFEVGWQESTHSVTLDGQVVLTIGQNTYTGLDNVSRQYEVPAELHNGVTYVPLSFFFREVLGLKNAYVLEKQMFIDNGERME